MGLGPLAEGALQYGHSFEKPLKSGRRLPHWEHLEQRRINAEVTTPTVMALQKPLRTKNGRTVIIKVEAQITPAMAHLPSTTTPGLLCRTS